MGRTRRLLLLAALLGGAGCGSAAAGPPEPGRATASTAAPADPSTSPVHEARAARTAAEEGARPAEAQAGAASLPTPAPPRAVSREEEIEARVATLLAELPDSQSVGGPNYGSLEHAAAMPLEGPGFRFNPRRQEEARYGTREMVAALVRAAAAVERELPGSVLFVNDLGYEAGGPIVHHGSHQNGRDVDVLFYLVDRDGVPMEPVGAPLDPRGRGTDFKDLADPSDDVQVRLDVPRTWRFVQALIEDGGAPLNRIFLVEHLRAILLEHAQSVGAPEATVARFADLTCQPGAPHDDHFHFRFFCAPDDIAGGCHDTAPIYPWHRELLADQGLEPVRASFRRVRAPTVSPEEARQSAGRMHWKVTRFLERRTAWMEQPRPGRPYCR